MLKAVQLENGMVIHRQQAMMLACKARCSRGMRFRSVISRMENVTVRALRYSSTNMTTDMHHASTSVRLGPLATLSSRSRKPIRAPDS